MSDAHGVPRDHLLAFITRIERLEEEKKAIASDIKDVYGEAKGFGYDTVIMKRVIALRKKDANERDEEEAILDTYMIALGMIPEPTLFDEPYDHETGELSPRLAKQVVDGMQTEAGRAALIAAVDIMIEREEAEEHNPRRPSNNDEASPEAGPQAEASPAGTGTGTLADREGRSEGEEASVVLPTNSPETATTQRVNGHSQHEGANAQATVHNEVVTVGGDESGTTASIPLTNGKFAVVDADDAQALMAHNWQAIKHGNVWYAKRRLENSDGKSVYMHRSIAAPKDGELVDHEDGDGLNNRKANLRIAVQAQNRANSGPSKNNKIGVKGVYHDAERGKWIAKVCFDYGQEVIGRFDTITEAAAAYDERAEVLWGEFAYLNRHHVDFNVVGTESGTVSNYRSDGGLNIVHKHTEIASGDNAIIYESVPPRPMKTLAYAHCFPELSKTAYQCLAGDIALNGVLEPIIRHGDVIIDGWSRYNAARSLGIEYPVIRYSGNDVLIDVIGWQRSSRDWTPAQERKIATALAKELPDRADDIWAAFHQAETSENEEVVAA